MALPGSYNIKYKTRNHLQRAIQQEINRQGLIGETKTMYDSIRISAGTGDVNNLYVEISAIYYYMFLDKGAELTNGGNIRPHYITQNALASNNGQRFIREAIDEYITWMIKKYPFLNTETVGMTVDNVKVNIQYNLFGSDDDKWNKIFDYDKMWNIYG
jgi:hypothetical protein